MSYDEIWQTWDSVKKDSQSISRHLCLAQIPHMHMEQTESRDETL